MEKLYNFFDLPFNYSHYVVGMLLISMVLMTFSILSRLLKLRKFSVVVCLSAATLDLFSLIPLCANYDGTNSFFSKIISIIILAVIAIIIKAQSQQEVPKDPGFKTAVYILDVIFPLIYVAVAYYIAIAVVTNF